LSSTRRRPAILKKLDALIRNRILKFLAERVAKLENPRAIGEALRGARRGASGNIAWATIGYCARSRIARSASSS